MFDVHNFFLGMLLKFAWLLGTRVGEKGGGRRHACSEVLSKREPAPQKEQGERRPLKTG